MKNWIEGTDNYGRYADFTVNGATQHMRWIEPGEFMMGSPEDEKERFEDEIYHNVILTRGFWLADTACTQELWSAVMGNNLAYFKGANRPVEQVSWDDVQKFIQRLNGLMGDHSFRLPTEAEWEYTCRAGTVTPFSFGKNITPELVNYNGNYPYDGAKKGLYREQTVSVKELPCNDWGLYQMHGNVWEWCKDRYGEYPTESVVDPVGPEQGVTRVLRGGSWIDGASSSRSADRYRLRPDSRFRNLGFRLARSQLEVVEERKKRSEQSRTGEAERNRSGLVKRLVNRKEIGGGKNEP